MNYQYSGNSLAHFGILGQKWGVRRFQNPDGTLTPEGRKRYLQEETNEKGEEEVTGVTKEGQKEFFKGDSSQLTKEGQKFQSDIHNDKDLRSAISQLQYGRRYMENGNWVKIYNEVTDYFNARLGPINDEWNAQPNTEENFRAYCKKVCDVYQKGYRDVLVKNLGNYPTGDPEDVHKFLQANGIGYSNYEDPDAFIDDDQRKRWAEQKK